MCITQIRYHCASSLTKNNSSLQKNTCLPIAEHIEHVNIKSANIDSLEKCQHKIHETFFLMLKEMVKSVVNY